MNGIRFYHEFKDKGKRRSAGTVVAALLANGCFRSGHTVCYEALAGLFDHSNSVVCGTAVSLDYLREKCKRIGEAKAQTIHPALFEKLNQS
jgi:hypothetical protein